MNYYIINFSKLRYRVRNETTLISAKNGVGLSSIYEVRNYITVWPRFLAHPVCVCLCSHGRTFEPISTKFGTDVRNLKQKNTFFGVKIH